jgi:glyoxylase-like metal-dependent hydrolase (beta-lactamase superfamily II)
MSIFDLRAFSLGVILIAMSPLADAQAPVQAAAPAAAPLVKAGTTIKISEHVFVIPDEQVPMVPNVGIIVGKTATLVVDPGMGVRGGEIVLSEVAKVSQNKEIYIVSTHFHPEHATGEAGFPQTAKVIRATAQQQDIEEMGMKWVQNFASRSPVIADVLKGITGFRQPAELFEKEKTIDLGGVNVRVVRLGPGHTRGDTVVFVEKDRVLFSGDLAMSGLFPAFATPQSSVRSWLTSLDELDKLKPLTVIGAHYPITDASVIGEYRGYLKALQARVAALKKEGKTSDEAAVQARAEFAKKYPDWSQPLRIHAAATAIYAENTVSGER